MWPTTPRLYPTGVPSIHDSDMLEFTLDSSASGESDAPKKPARPLANPDLFRTASGTKSSLGNSRKVSFQHGPPDEIKDRDMYGSATTSARPTSASMSSKWQPLSTVEPSPVADNDPFSLDDSDEEMDAKPIQMKDEDDYDRVQKATADAMKDEIGDPTNTASK